MNDILDRLDAAIGGPDRRTKDGRPRRTTPTKIETQLLLDAKEEIERLTNLVRLALDEKNGVIKEIERLRLQVESLQHQVAAASHSADQWDALARKAEDYFYALLDLTQHLHPGVSLRMMDTWDAPWPQVAEALRK